MIGNTMRSTSTLLLAISMMMLASCGTPGTGKPAHCVTKEQFPNYYKVARSKLEIHKPDMNGAATQHIEYASRVAQLEGRCQGINALRDE